jgi:hypothetical protein
MNLPASNPMDSTHTLPNPMPRFSPLGSAASAATVLAAAGGAACWLWLATLGARPTTFGALLCAGPALVTAALGFTSQNDRHQYVARVLAAAMMLPVLLMMWAVSHELPGPGLPAWGEAVSVFGFMLLHIAGFAALIWQLSSLTTRIEAEARTTPVSARVLAARLQSLVQTLGEQGAPWSCSAGEVAGEWRIDSHCAFAQGEDGDGRALEPRFHRVLLNLRPGAREVQVRERLGADNAAPVNADEASLRSGGDEWFDPSRPQAQRVWQRTWQTTMVQPDRLAAVRLQLLGDQAQAERHAAADATAMVTLLAALVTRSGWSWQPVMRLRA